MIQLGTDPILQSMFRQGLPLTRENYELLAFGEETDNAELLDQVPQEVLDLKPGQEIPRQDFIKALDLAGVEMEETDEDGLRAEALRRLKVRRDVEVAQTRALLRSQNNTPDPQE